MYESYRKLNCACGQIFACAIFALKMKILGNPGTLPNIPYQPLKVVAGSIYNTSAQGLLAKVYRDVAML